MRNAILWSTDHHHDRMGNGCELKSADLANPVERCRLSILYGSLLQWRGIVCQLPVPSHSAFTSNVSLSISSLKRILDTGYAYTSTVCPFPQLNPMPVECVLLWGPTAIEWQPAGIRKRACIKRTAAAVDRNACDWNGSGPTKCSGGSGGNRWHYHETSDRARTYSTRRNIASRARELLRRLSFVSIM